METNITLNPDGSIRIILKADTEEERQTLSVFPIGGTFRVVAAMVEKPNEVSFLSLLHSEKLEKAIEKNSTSVK